MNVSEQTLTAPAPDSPPMGTFDEDGVYIPRQITENDLGTLTLEEAYLATVVDLSNGQLVRSGPTQEILAEDQDPLALFQPRPPSGGEERTTA